MNQTTRLQEYLNRVADQGNLDATNSGHGRFWNVPYTSFRHGFVPNKLCNGAEVPIINEGDKLQSGFCEILRGRWCTSPSMHKCHELGHTWKSPDIPSR